VDTGGRGGRDVGVICHSLILSPFSADEYSIGTLLVTVSTHSPSLDTFGMCIRFCICLCFFLIFWYSNTKLVITAYHDREDRGMEGGEGREGPEGGMG